MEPERQLLRRSNDLKWLARFYGVPKFIVEAALFQFWATNTGDFTYEQQKKKLCRLAAKRAKAEGITLGLSTLQESNAR